MPPTASVASKMVKVAKPWASSSWPAARPAGPAPMTAIRSSSGIGADVLGGWETDCFYHGPHLGVGRFLCWSHDSGERRGPFIRSPESVYAVP